MSTIYERYFPERIQELSLMLSYDDGTTYVLPNGWYIKDIGSFTVNNELNDVALIHGSIMSGSNKIGGRTITVQTDIRDETKDSYRLTINNLLKQFHKTNYKLIVPDINMFYSVAGISKIKTTDYEGFKGVYTKLEISLLLADPFYKSIDLSTIDITVDTDKKEYEIPIYVNSALDTPPTIKIEPLDKTTKVPSVYIKKYGAVDYFEYKDAQLAYPMYATINSEEGTVYRVNSVTGESVNNIRSLSGIFLSLDPGQTTLLYTGGPVHITITYRGRWYI